MTSSITNLFRSLNDFLVHLSRACPKPPARATRRHHYPLADVGAAPMNKFAKQLSENIFKQHKESLASAKDTGGILMCVLLFPCSFFMSEIFRFV